MKEIITRMFPFKENMWLSVTLVTPGDGKTVPKAGQTVCVHYEGKFDDSDKYYHSTRQKGKPVRFVVGEGNVLKGLEEGIKRMSVGERATIMCTGKYIQGSKTGKKCKQKDKDYVWDNNKKLILDVLLLSCT